MEKYHKYVFDLKKRKLIGKFEKMYVDESISGFDSWHQEDNSGLDKKICFDIYESYNFSKVLDIGCGKGSFTQLLKKKNNTVVGIDISKTAIKLASDRYADIHFEKIDITKRENLKKMIKNFGIFSLITCFETLSYINNWKIIIKEFSKMSDNLLLKLFIPDNPIGFVKSENELVTEFQKHYCIINHITINDCKIVILYGKSKNRRKET